MPVRLLLVGEGPAEYGREEDDAEGVVALLVRSILGVGERSALAFHRQRIANLARHGDRPRGVRKALAGDARMAFAALRLARDHDGLIIVRDADRKGEQRRAEIERGLAAAIEEHPDLDSKPVVVGIPKETLEAWLLGDAGAFERAFGKPPNLPRAPETLWGKPRDPEGSHPKQLVKRTLREIGVRDDPVHLAEARTRLAVAIDPAALAAACPASFAPFRSEVEAKIRPVLDRAG